MNRALAAIVLATGLLTPLGTAAVVYVDDDAPPGGNGQSWTTAFKFLQDALTAVAADPNAEIRVAPGTYKPDHDAAHPSGTANRTATFQLRNGLAIYGGYAGLGAPDPDAHDPNTFISILSGDIGAVGDPNDNAYHVVTAPTGTSATAVLDGVRVTGGNGNSAGGGLRCSGSPTVTDCTFSGNRAGGLFNYSGSPTLTNCTFSGNSTGAQGGGLCSPSGRPTLTNCTFSGNTATAGGGGLYAAGVTLLNCTFSGNTVTGSGGMGGGAWSAGSTTLTNCVFSGNSVTGSDGRGGGAYHGSGTLTSCVFSGNSASSSGGGLYSAGSPALTDCVFSGNSASSSGGGMYCDGGAPMLTNCVLGRNAAEYGGGLYSGLSGGYSSPTLVNCTVSENAASSSGGGLYNASTLTLTDCTINGNSAALEGGGVWNRSSCTATLTRCTVSGNAAGDYGGGVCNMGTAKIRDCVFRGNSTANWKGTHSTSAGGGGLYTGSGATVTNCAFIGNSACCGGGVQNTGGLGLTNCTFSANSVSYHGGGLYNDAGSPVLTNCTFTDNSAVSGTTPAGGAIYRRSGAVTLRNCIVWRNAGAEISASSSGGTAATYSDIRGGFAGTGNLNLDPRLVFSAEGIARLRPGSPCIDAGDPNFAVDPNIPTDPDGNPRIVDGNGDGVARVDMGAYEYVPATAQVQVMDVRRAIKSNSSAWQRSAAARVDAQTPIYVDDDAPAGGDGTSWDTALRFLQDALAVAVAGDEIHVAQGTYWPDRDTAHPDGTGSRNATFLLGDGVALIGGYSGLDTPDPDARDVAAFPSTLSGDVGVAGDPNDNSYHVVTIGPGVTAATVLDGFIVADGNASGAVPQDRGGGLYNSSGDPTLVNCTFRGNRAAPQQEYKGGAGLYNASGDPTLTNCTFSGNVAVGGSGRGGGMLNDGGSPVVTDCVFRGNLADLVGGGLYSYGTTAALTVTGCLFSGNSGGASVGGLINYKGNLTLADCTFLGNSTHGIGGGLESNSGRIITIVGCTFNGNSAWAPATGASGLGYGGGAYLSCDFESATATLADCRFSGNVGGAGGGLCLDSDATQATLVLANCTLAGNSASYEGGGLESGGYASQALVSCVFEANSAGYYGGGLCCRSSSSATGPRLRNCTLSANLATYCGGLYNAFGEPALTNCILWGNSSGQIVGTATVTYCDVQGGWPGAGNIDLNPFFVGPGDPGGDPNAWLDSSHLSALSPCIDAGDPAFVADPNETDIDGEPRVQHCRVDMGADESPYFVDCNGNGVGDACDITDGTSQDCNRNGVPDECDLSGGGSRDCNTNGLPDECDIAAGTSQDRNSNGIPDECEPDCNGNAVPDDWDIATGTSLDCNSNGVPDECELTGHDCNTNGVPDKCDIQAAFGGGCEGTAYPPCDTDYNHNGVPDHCEPCGDLNGDTQVDELDYAIMLAGFGRCAPDSRYVAAAAMDVNSNGCIDLVDYQAWFMCYKMANGKAFVPPAPPPPPKPPAQLRPLPEAAPVQVKPLPAVSPVGP